MATLSSATVPATAAIVTSRKSTHKTTKITFINGLNSFGGLKAHNNNVASLGLPISTQQSFATIVNSLSRSTKTGGRGGGALSSTCNVAAEIFKISVVLPALVLVGVAVGFLLLRIEATVEEAAE